MYKEVNYLLKCVWVINMACEVKFMIMYMNNFFFIWDGYIGYSLSFYILFMNLFAFSYHYDHILISQKS